MTTKKEASDGAESLAGELVAFDRSYNLELHLGDKSFKWFVDIESKVRALESENNRLEEALRSCQDHRKELFQIKDEEIAALKKRLAEVKSKAEKSVGAESE